MYLKDNDPIRQTRKTLQSDHPYPHAFAMVGINFLSIAVLGFLFGISLVIAMGPAAQHSLEGFINTLGDQYFISFLFFELAGIISVYLFSRKANKRTLASLGLKGKDRVKKYLLGIFLGLFLFSLVAFLAWKSGGIALYRNPRSISSKTFILFILGWMIQGFNEEFVCRSGVMNLLAVKYGAIHGILANSLIFSLLHFGNPGLSALALVNLFLFGVICSLLFYLTENIFLPAALHSFWNFAQGNLFGAQVSGLKSYETVIFRINNTGPRLLNGGAFGLEGSIFTFLVLAIALGVLIWILHKRKCLTKEDPAALYAAQVSSTVQ